MADLLKQLHSIKAQVAKNGTAELDASTRGEAAALAHGIMLDIEDPNILIERIIYQPVENALLRIAVEIGLFEIMSQSNGPLTAEDLATKTKVELVLLERLLRGLAAMQAVEEIGDDGYGMTKISAAFTTAKGISMCKIYADLLYTAWFKVPQLLKTTKYRNPTNSDDTAFNVAWDTKDSVFEVLAREPERVRTFGAFMASMEVGRPHFLDFFPAEEKVIAGYKSKVNKDGVIFVDIGGAQGSEALKFHRRFPSHPGRVVLQERAEVLAHAPKIEGLEVQTHDFFTRQPIRGARVYYFRRIHHDWDDTLSLKILRRTAEAMAPGYSKMIINDMIMPRRGASSVVTNQDFHMMAVCSSIERTEQMWRDLLYEAGLKIVKIWFAEGAVESVIEAMLELPN
ncbi:MAG: hypothetical protein Q9169_004086 [Polycauliona sp. 2 TL-2023]